ncbi:glycosyltransferase family 2 protein [Baekduia sp. Peel2402]|uniref:glycosyltransferase family 2 protein n=1 Tax=Baekduia sp. Peel2402 TaxID=3458296 RepID=UPI00403E72AE
MADANGRSALPHVGVVIPTYNGAHVLRPCLDALLQSPPRRCTMTIVVVDDAGADRTPELLAEYADAGVVALTHEDNRGFAHACNTGAAAVPTADHVVFLNNDTIPLDGWLDALVDEAAEHPEAGAIGARLLYPDGTVQHAGIAIGQDRWPRHLYPGFPGEHPAVLRSRELAAVTAACVLVPRTDLDTMGGFDTDYLNGYEDVDLCLRLREAGRTVRYCARSVLYHLESVTRWPTGKPESTEHNDRLYHERWAGKVVPDDLGHYVADGLLRVEYGAFPPLRVVASPLLAAVDLEGAEEDPLATLLRRRTAQVMELEGVRIRAGLDEQRVTEDARLAGRAPEPARGAEVLRRGGRHRLPGATGASPRLVSVLLPVKDGAADLREQLPVLLGQELDAELEIVAVDSASTDESRDVLAEFDATIIGIDPADFDHGLTRNLAAQHASGDVLVLLTHNTRPLGNRWLAPLVAALDDDPTVAGACSRVTPHPDADLLARRDGELDPSGSSVRSVKRIDDYGRWAGASPEERRLLANFHTVAAALRAEHVRRLPFRAVRAIGEDLLWAQEVLESGLALVHEPASHALHSHAYSLRERFTRNVDDGIANHDIVGRSLAAADVEPLVRGMVAGDWAFLAQSGLTGDELAWWQVESVLRRVAQASGQWLGTNHEAFPREAVDAFSRVVAMRRRAARDEAS